MRTAVRNFPAFVLKQKAAMEKQSIRSLKKMAKMKEQTQRGEESGNSVTLAIDDLGEYLLHNILSRLPALSFASAACVSRSWNSLCNRVLSYPKLSSAVSFNPCLEDAVDEVVDKVLAEPIRPQFALVSIAPYLSLQAAHQLITGKLSSRIPVITNVSEGIIGRDVLTDKFVEVQWEVTEEDEDLGDESPEEIVNRGIILTVGFLPGLKAHIIPLWLQCKAPQRLLIDEFVMDIRGFASAVSDSESPAGIILFVQREVNIKPVLQMMEYAFPSDTVIVGDMGSHILYRSDSRNHTTRRPNSIYTAVALSFARDRNKPLGIGETQFDVILSTGISPIGSPYKAGSVKCNETSTMLTAARVTLHEHLDGQAILEEIYDELGDRIQYPAFYIGVTKRRRCSIGTEKVRRIQFREFHEVMGGNEEYLFVNSVGIKTGDPFRFYISDSKAALSSCYKASVNFRRLKQDCDKRKVFGGIIFTCCGRGDSFFGCPGIDSSPFLENFPGVAFGGTYCSGEIGRGNLSLYEEDNEGVFVRSCQHVYSAVYLVMSYSPPPPPQH